MIAEHLACVAFTWIFVLNVCNLVFPMRCRGAQHIQNDNLRLDMFAEHFEFVVLALVPVQIVDMSRRIQGTAKDGKSFDTRDEWQLENYNQKKSPCTGQMIFVVDIQYFKEYGADKRRQRTTAENRPKVSA